MRRSVVHRLLNVAAVVAVFSLALASASSAQTHPTASVPMPFGSDGVEIPPSTFVPATPPRVVELLSKALAAHPAESRRVELVRNLGECGIPAGLPAIISAMADSDPVVRAQAAQSAAKVGDASALVPLRPLLKDADVHVRIQAGAAGVRLKDLTFAAAGLADEDERCFTAVCSYASTAEHYQLIAKRLPALSAMAKRIAVRTLGHSKALEFVPVIAGQIQFGDITLTIASIDALAELRATDEAEAVKSLLSHEHPTVRRAALDAMAALVKDSEKTAIALRMLGDADLTVRASACSLLAAHPTADAVEVLFVQLRQGYAPLRVAARRALVASASIAGDAVFGAAAALLDDPDRDRRVDGSFILGMSRSDVAFEKHVQLLSDPDWLVVQQAADSLGEIGRGEAAEMLGKIAARSKPSDEAAPRGPNENEAIGAAFIACGKLDYKPALAMAQALIPQKLTSPIIIRARAIWVAGRLASADDRTVANSLLSVANDNSPYENEEARFEAIKAIGNQRYAPALEEMRRQSREHIVPALRWMAHLTADRLAGAEAPTPYTPPTVKLIAETAIQELEN